MTFLLLVISKKEGEERKMWKTTASVTNDYNSACVLGSVLDSVHQTHGAGLRLCEAPRQPAGGGGRVSTRAKGTAGRFAEHRLRHHQ